MEWGGEVAQKVVPMRNEGGMGGTNGHTQKKINKLVIYHTEEWIVFFH